MPAGLRDAEAAAPSPVYGLLKNPSLVDFPGRLARVFFLSGCNFTCDFCHNTELARRQPGLPWARILETLEADRAEWVDGVVLSGGEPTLTPQLESLVNLVRARGFAVKLDTNGSRPDVLEALLDRLDYIAMDLKCPLADYPAVAGFHDVGAVRRSLDLILARARDYEFRTTVLEDVHTGAAMADMAASIRGARRYILQAFLPRENLPGEARRHARRTPPDVLERLAAIARPFVQEVRLRGAGL